MSVSLSEVGLFCLAVYLILIGAVALLGLKMNSKVANLFALIAGVCILIGLFVGNMLVI